MHIPYFILTLKDYINFSFTKVSIEDPGYIKDLMIKDGAELTTIELDEGQKIPSDLREH